MNDRNGYRHVPDSELRPVEEIRAVQNVDAYVFTLFDFVKRDGVFFLNPPPDDRRCESCHRDEESRRPYSDRLLKELEARWREVESRIREDKFDAPLGMIGLRVVNDSKERPVLAKQFQRSKIDGANIAAWLCPTCIILPLDQRDVRI